MENNKVEEIKIGSEIGQIVVCSSCQNEGTTDQFVTFQNSKEHNLYVCPTCRDQINLVLKEETENPNILLAIIFGVLGAAIGGIIWYFIAVCTGMEIGYMSIGLGYLIGFGVHTGSRKKRGHQLQIISALLALLTIIITEKVIFDCLLNDYIATHLNEFSNLPSGASVSISFFAPEFWKEFITPIGIFIYSLGVYFAYKFCEPREVKILN